MLAATLPTIVMLATPPAGSVPKAQGRLYSHPVLVMSLGVKPVGSVSVTCTPTASDGPLFVTTIR